MTVLTVRNEWTQPDYMPGSLFESPFEEISCTPRFADVLYGASQDADPYAGSLEAFAAGLVACVDAQLKAIDGPVHVLLSGGYDSRIVAFLLERAGREPLCVTDGMEEPACSAAMDTIGIPDSRRYVHDMSRPDPYGLVDATCDGFAPLFTQLRFAPGDPAATLVTGLGGGEWFSYPASGWLRGKRRRVPGDDVVSMWLDCWPQYPLIVDAWADGYRDAIHPYCTVAYARQAMHCRPEWLVETDDPTLDVVRHAMICHLDERLLEPGWAPHAYPWNLTGEQRERIDSRYLDSWVGRTYHQDEWGLPSEMDAALHACTMAGFATWCDELAAQGHEIRAAA